MEPPKTQLRVLSHGPQFDNVSQYTGFYKTNGTNNSRLAFQHVTNGTVLKFKTKNWADNDVMGDMGGPRWAFILPDVTEDYSADGVINITSAKDKNSVMAF